MNSGVFCLKGNSLVLELTQTVVERATGHTEIAGGLGLVAVKFYKCLDHAICLRITHIKRCAARCDRLDCGGIAEVLAKLSYRQLAAVLGLEQASLDDVAKLP